MAINFACSNAVCGKPVKAPDGTEGRSSRCPHCQTIQKIPGLAKAAKPAETKPAQAKPAQLKPAHAAPTAFVAQKKEAPLDDSYIAFDLGNESPVTPASKPAPTAPAAAEAQAPAQMSSKIKSIESKAVGSCKTYRAYESTDVPRRVIKK